MPYNCSFLLLETIACSLWLVSWSRRCVVVMTLVLLLKRCVPNVCASLSQFDGGAVWPLESSSFWMLIGLGGFRCCRFFAFFETCSVVNVGRAFCRCEGQVVLLFF